MFSSTVSSKILETMASTEGFRFEVGGKICITVKILKIQTPEKML